MPALCIEEYATEPTVTCVTAGPIFKKMKVLKKFKRRMGLAGRGSSSSNQPPLTFHSVCGDNVRISNDGKVARRAESFCKGVAFSARPIKVGEKVCLRLLEVSTNWSGVIRFGFTSQDPAGLRDALPKYACPDLTNKPGYWAKALSERFAEQGIILFYYVDSAGDVHFGINGEERGVFFGGVDTRAQLWGLFDVYGNSTAVEFVDPMAQLNNRVRIVNDLSPGSSQANSRVLPQRQPSPPQQTQPKPQQPLPQQPLPQQPLPQQPPQPQQQPQRPDAGVDRLQPSMAQLALTPRSPDALPLRHHAHTPFTPLPFHRVRGRNVRMNNDRTVAARSETEYSHGYVFTARPLRPGEKLVVQVLHTEAMYVGALAFGLTSANPAGLESADLPEDCDLLLDRPEYWVVSKDVAASPQSGDELAFALTHHGEVTFSRNGSAPQVFMHVDHTLQLWAFFDVYGNTSKIRSLGVFPEHTTQTPASSSPPRRPEPVGRASHSQLSRASPLVVSLPLLEHQCIPNTTRTFDPHLNLILRAAVDITKGQHITTSYSDPMWGTANRQLHLRTTKYFKCTCERCTDASELGTHLSSLKCTKCGSGHIMPSPSALSPEAWVCASCDASLNLDQVDDFLTRTGERLINLKDGPPKVSEAFLKETSTKLSENHYYRTDVKIALAQLYGRSGDERTPHLHDLSKDLLERKEALCREVLILADKFSPGKSRLRGLLLFELQAALKEKHRRLPKKLKTSAHSKKLLQEASGACEEAREVLLYESPLQDEYQMGVQADLDLKALHTLLAKCR